MIILIKRNIAIIITIILIIIGIGIIFSSITNNKNSTIDIHNNYYHPTLNTSDSLYKDLLFYVNFDTDNVNTITEFSQNKSSTYLYGLNLVAGMYGNAINCSTGMITNNTNKLTFIKNSSYLNDSWSYSWWVYNMNNSRQNYGGIITDYVNATTTVQGLYSYTYIQNTSNINIINVYNTTYSASYTATASLNNWTHFVAIRNKDTKRWLVYTNGALTGNVTDNSVNFSYSDNRTLNICQQSGVNSEAYLDEIMIFNRSLTPTEISNIYNNQSNRFNSGGLYYVNFTDLISGLKSNLTLTNIYTNVSTSTINISVDYYNGSWFSTAYQQISSSNTFNISNSSTKVNVNYLFITTPSFTSYFNSSNYSFYNPISTISGTTNGTGIYYNNSVNLICSIASNDTLQNVTLYEFSNNTEKNVSTISRGAFGEVASGTNITISYNAGPPNEPVTLGIVNVTTSDPWNIPNGYNVTTLFDNSEAGYAQLTADARYYPSFDRPIWIKFKLNDTYLINRVKQLTYSLSDFRCSDYDIDISLNDITYTNVIQARNLSSLYYNDSFSPTNGRYIKLTCYNHTRYGIGYYPSWGEIWFYGQLLSYTKTVSYAIVNFSSNISLLSTATNNFSTLYCKTYDINGVGSISNNLTYYIGTAPIIPLLSTNITVLNLSYAYTNFSANCNTSDSYGLSIKVNISYKNNDNDTWNDVPADYVPREVMYAHGDSLSSGNWGWIAYLDNSSMLGSNITATNASNSSQFLYNFARGGWTCQNIYQGLNGDSGFNMTNSNIPNNTKMIILCGINGYADIATNEQYMELIQQTATSRNISLMWISILTATNASLYVDTGIPNRIYTINEWLRTNLSSRYNSTYIDGHTAIWNGTYGFCGNDTNGTSFCNADGLHLSSNGQAMLAKRVWERAFDYKRMGYYHMSINGTANMISKNIDLKCTSNNGYFTNSTTLLSALSVIRGYESTDSGTGGPVTTDTSSDKLNLLLYPKFYKNGSEIPTILLPGQKFDGFSIDIAIQNNEIDTLINLTLLKIIPENYSSYFENAFSQLKNVNGSSSSIIWSSKFIDAGMFEQDQLLNFTIFAKAINNRTKTILNGNSSIVIKINTDKSFAYSNFLIDLTNFFIENWAVSALLVIWIFIITNKYNGGKRRNYEQKKKNS